MARPKNFLRSITVTAPHFALGSPSRTRWKNNLARPRSGHGCAPLISTWPKEVPVSSRAVSEHNKIRKTTAFVQAADRLGEQRSDRQDNQLFVLREIVQPKRRHRIGSDDLVKRRIDQNVT